MKIKKIFLPLIICLLTAQNTLANISIFPYNVDFQDTSKKRVQSVRVINTSDKTQTYRVSVINFTQDENGKLTEVNEHDYSAKKHLTWSPRQFTLKPHEVQTINLARKSLSNLKDGEYISHFKVAEVDVKRPDEVKAKNENPDTLSMNLRALFAVTIPVTIEKGKTGVRKTSVISYNNVNGEKLNVTLKREGNISSYVNIVILDNKGKELGRVNSVRIYLSAEKLNIDVPLNTKVKGVNAVLKLEDAKSKKEILRQNIKL